MGKLKLVNQCCDTCSVELFEENENFGFEEDQNLCQTCYNTFIDQYEGDLIEAQSIEQRYADLLNAYKNICVQLNNKNKRLKQLKQVMNVSHQ